MKKPPKKQGYEQWNALIEVKLAISAEQDMASLRMNKSDWTAAVMRYYLSLPEKERRQTVLPNLDGADQTAIGRHAMSCEPFSQPQSVESLKRAVKKRKTRLPTS